MAVSKRARFEVLRRDDYTCRYCRSREEALTIDHVLPVALGGSDDPSNLVACCKDCNSGKTSSSPDATTVTDVADVALKYSQALRENILTLTVKWTALRKTRLSLEAYWEESADAHGLWSAPPMDSNWSSTLERWLSVGLDAEFLAEAMDITMAKSGIANANRFRYFCGVIYRTLDQAHSAITDTTSTPTKCGHCDSCIDSAGTGEDSPCEIRYEPAGDDDEPYSCPVCSRSDCMYDLGVQAGMAHEWRANADAITHYRKCPERSL